MKRLRKRHVILVVAILVTAGTLWCLLRFTPIVPRQIAQSFTANLLHDRGYRLEIGEVRGHPFGDLVFVDARLVSERDGPIVVASAHELRARVQVWNLLRGRVAIRRLRLVQPEVRFGAHGVQRDLLVSPGRRGPRAPLPSIHVGKLEIVDGHVWGSGGSQQRFDVRDIDLEAGLDVNAQQVRVRLHRAAAAGPWADLALLDAAGEAVWRGDSLHFERLRLRTPRSALLLEGVLRPREGSIRVAGMATPLEVSELAGFLQLPVEGRLDGPVRAAWQDGRLEFAGTWSGDVNGYDVRDVQLELLWTPERLEVRQAAGRVQDSPFELALEASQGTLQGNVRVRSFDLRDLQPDLPETRLQGSVQFRRRSEADTLRLDVELGSTRVSRWSFDRALGSLSLHGDRVWIHRAEVRAAEAGARFEGTIEDGQLDLDWELEADDVAALLGPLDVAGLHGELSLRGSLYGPLDDLACDAAAAFEALHYADLHVPRG
ncbi:MAG: hypothetical protein ACE5G2_13235, partial [Candidatus Krumholzibacteriia bacterium]